MDIINKINKTRYTLKEILEDDWDTSTIANLSNEEIEVMYQNVVDDDFNGCNFSITNKHLPSVKLHVIYHNLPAVGEIQKKNIKNSFNKIYEKFYKDYFNMEDSVFIIINEKISETLEKNINNLNVNIQNEISEIGISKDIKDEMNDKNYHLDQKHLGMCHLFYMNDLTINKLKHRLVPQHKAIRNKQEIDEILEKCNCQLNQLPVILKNDAIAKLIRLAVDDICEIKRQSIKSGEYSFYRVCK